VKRAGITAKYCAGAFSGRFLRWARVFGFIFGLRNLGEWSGPAGKQNLPSRNFIAYGGKKENILMAA